MQGKKLSVFKKVFFGLFMCSFIAGSVFASMSDPDFFDLCAGGILQQVVNAIESGANVNEQNEYGVTPLIWAASHNSNPEVITALIRAGANVNAKDVNGVTALMAAAALNSNPRVVITLLNFGADPKAEDSHGQMAVDHAEENASLRNTEALRRLEEADHRLPAQPAAMSDAEFIALCEGGSLQQIISAIENGANVNAQDQDGTTPLMWAVFSNHNSEVIRTLINAGANVNEQEKSGRTPLMWAVSHISNPGIVTALIRAGANVNAKDQYGATPLMIAAAVNPNPEVITTLLNLGADVSAKDNNGNIAVNYARTNISLENTDALRQLEERSR